MCAALETIYAGIISDVLHQDLSLPNQSFAAFDKYTRGISGFNATCGPAFTTRGRDVIDSMSTEDLKEWDKMRVTMLDRFPQGGIQVLQSNWKKNVAHYGDITARTIKQAGGKGAIVDGFTRDWDALDLMKFSLMTHGMHPKDSIGTWTLTDHSQPIVIYGVEIKPLDIVHMSPDGVVVIPSDLLEKVTALAHDRFHRENHIKKLLATKSPIEVYESEGRW